LSDSRLKKINTRAVRAAIVLVIGFTVIGITLWKTIPRNSRSQVPPTNAKFMHCPDCKTEVPFEITKIDDICMTCGSEKGWIATRESIKEGTAKSPYGRMVAFLLPEIVVLLGLLWFVLKPRASGYREMYRYMRCQNCSQKLRFRAAQVGQLGACSKCKRAFRFPEGTPREQDLDGAHAYEHEEVTEEDR
jgi:hypothetical protein